MKVTADRIMKKIIKTVEAPQAIGPYSQAVEAGGFVFVSGQIPLEPSSGNLVQGDVREQTRRVLENAGMILGAAGCTMADVVKVTIYLKDMNDFTAVNYEQIPDEPTSPEWNSLLDHIILSPSAMSHYVQGSVSVPHPSGDGEHGPSDHFPVMLDLWF